MTALKQQLQHDMTEAMRAREQTKLSTLRMVLSAITNAEVAGTEAVTLDDAAVLAVLRAESRKRAEAAEIYAGAGRSERAEQELAEQAVIDAYLPAAMGDEQLGAIVAEEVAAAAAGGATGGRATGIVIKAVRARVGDQADGGRIAALVKTALG